MYDAVLSLLGFLISPFGLPIYFLLFFVVPLVIFFSRKAKRYEILRKVFPGSYSWRYGLRIHCNGKLFRFSEEGRSQGSIEYGGISLRLILGGMSNPQLLFSALEKI